MREVKKIWKWTITNTFIDEVVLTVTMWKNPHKSMDGHYHKFWQSLQTVLSSEEGVMKEKIMLKTSYVDGNPTRIIFEFPSGVKLDIPHDATKFDYKIILAQLNVLQMRFRSTI